jgi:hypothetical protein
MKAAVRPVHDPRHVSVLQGIEVNVVDVTFEIGLIANGVLPIAALPDAFFALRDLALRSRLRFDGARKSALDETSASREVAIIFGQCPQSVDVIRQDANGNRLKRTPVLNTSIDRSQAIDVFDQQIARSVGKNNREEKHAALYICTKIVRHGLSYHAKVKGGHASAFAR